jgi:hypothetical protein
MLTRIIIISLIITAIHVTTWDGMIFHRPAEWLGSVLDRFHASSLRKPLFECLICMGGVWTIVLDTLIFGWTWFVLVDMLAVIGLNTLISAVISRLHE